MIEALYNIGKLQKVGSSLNEFFEDIGNAHKHIFKIVFDINDVNDIKFVKIDYEEYDSLKKLKYLYKGKKGNSTDSTPTSKITEFEKTYQNKICRCLETFIKNHKTSITNKLFFGNLNKTFLANKEIIETNLDAFIEEKGLFISNAKTNDKGIKDGGVITFTFQRDNEPLYLGDLDEFVNIFNKQDNSLNKDYYSKYGKTSKTNNSYCYICHEVKDDIWGFVNTYNFYTADKSGFVTGGCRQELAWKNYPVCPDCTQILNRGKRYAESNLKNRFCGFSYLVVPEISFSNDTTLEQVLKSMRNYESFSLSENNAKWIENTEEKIMRDLSKENNMVNFNFLFFSVNNSEYKILLYLQEIPPSRLNYLIGSKNKVDSPENKQFNIFKKIATKKGDITFGFSFTFIRDFFNNSKIEGNFDKKFLDLVNNIFIGKSISFNFLLNRFMERIRRVFINDGMYTIDVLKGYKIFLFLELIKIFDRRRNVMDVQDMPYHEFFSENTIFDDNVKKAIFLEGVLAQKLLSIQYQERQATPFRTRLNGLKIDEKIAKRLLPEMINKLEEYEKNYYRELEQAIGQYMLKSSFSEYTVDELSFYFTLGMTLNDILIPKKSENETNKKEV